MKTLKQVCVASVLTLALSLSAFAGEIETSFTSPPQNTTKTGEIDTTLTATTAALSLLEAVLSLI